MKQDGANAAFSAVELVVFLATAALLVFILMAQARAPRHKTARIKCVNNLKTLALASRIFGTERTNVWPGAILLSGNENLKSIGVTDYFQWISNEVSTPKVLVCPDDTRNEARNFASLTPGQVSYFASLTATENDTQTFLFGDRHLQVGKQPVGSGMLTITTNLNLSWSKEIHAKRGNIALTDGSVQQFTSSRLQQFVRVMEPSTNVLLIP